MHGKFKNRIKELNLDWCIWHVQQATMWLDDCCLQICSQPTTLLFLSDAHSEGTQQKSYSISHLLDTVTTLWLDSDGVVTVINCQQHGDYTVVQLCSHRLLTTVTTLPLSSHCVVTVLSRWLIEYEFCCTVQQSDLYLWSPLSLSLDLTSMLAWFTFLSLHKYNSVCACKHKKVSIVQEVTLWTLEYGLLANKQNVVYKHWYHIQNLGETKYS